VVLFFEQRFSGVVQLRVELSPLALEDSRLDKVEVEEPFESVELPFSFAGLDRDDLASVGALDWMSGR
jgi:hypothetical protein